jgi:Flp pilus assembly protein TadG
MQTNQKYKRRGSAVVELAICLPVVMLLVWGTIELNNSIFIKQTVTSAAHEGALVGLKPNSTEAAIRTRVESVLDVRLDVDYSVSVETQSGEPFDTMAVGDFFTIVVTAQSKSFGDAVEIGEVDARISAIKQ